MKLTKPQTTVLATLYDVATHEGGGIVLKNRYHSAAHALIRKGLARKIERGIYRPHYIITPEGMNYWIAQTTKTLTLYVPTYESARDMRGMDEQPLSTHSPDALIELVKDRSRHAQAAAVILLHDFYRKSQLSRRFTEAEVQRYFAHLCERPALCIWQPKMITQDTAPWRKTN
jgi:hypothetical protein